jgi:hypothetical protein
MAGPARVVPLLFRDAPMRYDYLSSPAIFGGINGGCYAHLGPRPPAIVGY